MSARKKHARYSSCMTVTTEDTEAAYPDQLPWAMRLLVLRDWLLPELRHKEWL